MRKNRAFISTSFVKFTILGSYAPTRGRMRVKFGLEESTSKFNPRRCIMLAMQGDVMHKFDLSVVYSLAFAERGIVPAKTSNFFAPPSGMRSSYTRVGNRGGP